MLLSQGSQMFVEDFTPKATEHKCWVHNKCGNTLRAHGRIVFQIEFVFYFKRHNKWCVFTVRAIFCHWMQQDRISPDTEPIHTLRIEMDVIWWSLYWPESGVSVEMADNFIALLDLAEKVFLTWDFSVLTMAFIQKLLKKHWEAKQGRLKASSFCIGIKRQDTIFS